MTERTPTPEGYAAFRASAPKSLLRAYREAGAAVPPISHAAAQGLRDALAKAGLDVPADPTPKRTANASAARWRP